MLSAVMASVYKGFESWQLDFREFCRTPWLTFPGPKEGANRWPKRNQRFSVIFER